MAETPKTLYSGVIRNDKSIYVGNLSPRITQEEIRKLFESYGAVESVDLIIDRYPGESRGFAIDLSSASSENII